MSEIFLGQYNNVRDVNCIGSIQRLVRFIFVDAKFVSHSVYVYTRNNVFVYYIVVK